MSGVEEYEDMEIPPAPSLDLLRLSIFPKIVKTEFSNFDLFEFFREKYRSYDTSFIGEFDEELEIEFMGNDFVEHILPAEERGPLLFIFSFLSPVEIIRSHIYVCRGFYTTGHYLVNRRVVPFTVHHLKLLFGEHSCVNGDLFFRLIQEPFDVNRKIGCRGGHYTLLNFAIGHGFYKGFVYLIEERKMIPDENDFKIGIKKKRDNCLLRMIRFLEIPFSTFQSVMNVFIETKSVEALEYIFKEKQKIMNEKTLKITSKAVIGLFREYDEVTKYIFNLLNEHTKGSLGRVTKANSYSIIVTGFTFEKFKFMVNINPQSKYGEESSRKLYKFLMNYKGDDKKHIFDYIYEDRTSLKPTSYQMAYHYATLGDRKKVETLLPLLPKLKATSKNYYTNAFNIKWYQFLDYFQVKDMEFLNMLFTRSIFRVNETSVINALVKDHEYSWRIVRHYIEQNKYYYYEETYQKMDYCLSEAVKHKRDKIVDNILKLSNIRLSTIALCTSLETNSPHSDRIFDLVFKNKEIWKISQELLGKVFFSCLKGKYFEKANMLSHCVKVSNFEINSCVFLGCTDFAIKFLKLGVFVKNRTVRAVYVDCMRHALQKKCKKMVDEMLNLKKWDEKYWFCFQDAPPIILETLFSYLPRLRVYGVQCSGCRTNIPVLVKKCREDYYLCERDCWDEFSRNRERAYDYLLCPKCAFEKVEKRGLTRREYLKYYCKNCFGKYKDEELKSGYDNHNFKRMDLLSPYR